MGESANILAMNFDDILDIRMPGEIRIAIRDRFRSRRKEQKLSQKALANKAGVSLGSLKRFEANGRISLESLINLAFALGYEDDFSQLFAQKHYRTIQDVIDDARS